MSYPRTVGEIGYIRKEGVDKTLLVQSMAFKVVGKRSQERGRP
jgi:hypothetical protein